MALGAPAGETSEHLATRAPRRIAAIVAVFEDGTIVTHDDHFAALTGIPGSILAARRYESAVGWLRASGDETNRALAKLLEARVEPKRGGEIKGEIKARGGRVVEWLTMPLKVGGLRGSIWSFYDASFCHATAHALRDAETWIRMFTAHHDGVVLEMDAAARVVALWAPHATAFLGLPETTLRGRTILDLLGAPGAEFDRRIRTVLTQGQPASFELGIDFGGERRVFAVDAVPLPGHDREAASATMLVRDVTQQARLKSQLEQADRLASIGLLAAGIAHEINNPLGYMLLNLERVRSSLGRLGEEARPASRSDLLTELDHAMGVALEGAHRVQEIVRDLKHFARGDHDEPLVSVDIHAVLRGTLEMVTPELEQRARVVCELRPVPRVLASEGRLAQVFMNLLLNASHAIEAGDPPGNEIRIGAGTDERGRAVVEVRDTGAGIPDRIVRHIFDPFFTTKAPGLGTGLGLAICHGIVTAFGGFITVDTELGRGSAFRVVLPAHGTGD